MRIAVAAIALNEEKHVDRWANSARDADCILLADTGSRDGTVAAAMAWDWAVGGLLSTYVIHISPWRFDHARNAALALLPADIDLCITLDLDEILVPGWREIVESVWTPEATRLRYNYVWNWNADGTPNVQFQADRAHHRNGYQWKGAVHETICPSGVEHIVTTAQTLIHHHADDSKPRSSYLPLLELSVRENPMDDRASHYLGREYMFQGRTAEGIAELQRHLTLPTAKWNEERAASMRFLGRMTDDEGWYLGAVSEAPYSRDAWYELAQCRLKRHDWIGALQAATRALSITERPGHYLVTAEAWGYGPYDIASVAAWHMGLKDVARGYWEKAVEMAPNDARIVKNGEWMK
jgi:tetratricopeptide (TPR) repeat protein